MRKVWLLVILVLMFFCFLGGRYFSSRPASPAAGERRVLYWVDPMHPAYKSDKPGIAPDCGMQLEPVYADGVGPSAAASNLPPGTVSVTPEQQQLIGVRIEPVSNQAGSRTVRLLGRVVPDEEHTYRVTAGADGFIDKVFANPTGTMVKKGDRLATFNSPDIVAAEQTFLQGVYIAPGNRNEYANESDWRVQTGRIAANRLRALGVSEAQVQKMLTTRTIVETIDIAAPADGWVLTRNISSGQRCEKGAELYRIADLSRVWILADVFESEARYFRPGVMAAVRLPGDSKPLNARVSEALPQFDPNTRTMKVRLELANPGLRLRPEMFVDIEIAVKNPSGLSIPMEALIDSGLTKRVFVDLGNGYFEPRAVEVGQRMGGQVQIRKGLNADERIVTSGSFLIDSESRLKNPIAAPTPAHTHDHEAEMKPAAIAGQVPGQVKDPRCGITVDPVKARADGLTMSYKGMDYYFSSTSCKDDFQKSPEKYLASSHSGMGHD